MKKNLSLYKFHWDCGRSGSVEGIFVATEEEVKNAIGKEVSFGEILGKHSDVYGNLEEDDLIKVDIESSVIEQLVSDLGYNWSGYNPLDYIYDEE